MLNELEQALGTLMNEPTRADLFAFCEEQFVATGGWRDLIGLYETFGGASSSDGVPDWARLIERLESIATVLPVEERSMALETIGQLWETRLGRPEQALRQYQASFKLWPKNRTALSRAGAIYRAQGNWKLVNRLLELELHAVTEPLEQAELLVALGETNECHTGPSVGIW